MEISRAAGRDSVLVIWRHASVDSDRLARRLRSLYEPYLGPECQVTVRTCDGAGVVVAVVDARPGRDQLASVVAWGDPVGQLGVATADEVAEAARSPMKARELLGSFVLVSIGAATVSVTTSSDLVHTLKASSGPEGQAWSTQGLAAVVACARPLSLVAERIPEVVLFDFAFGDDELVDGVRVLDEAAYLELSPAGVVETTYWSVQDRLLATPGTNALTLRSAVCRVLNRVARREGATLALSAGRDSTLLASCLNEIDVAVPCFTFGDDRTGDGAGARQVAQILGWDHDAIVSDEEGHPSADRLLRATRWTEGLDTAWNLYSPPLRWPWLSDRVALFGIGGEMGRAFYWGQVAPDRWPDPVGLMTDWTKPLLSAEGYHALKARSESFADSLATQGWEGTGVLDGWHARGRVRKWPGRTPNPARMRSVQTVYTNAGVAAALLGIPAEQRRTKQVFDEAGRLGGDLHAVAGRARVEGATRPKGRRLLRRLRADDALSAGHQALREMGVRAPLTAEVLGPIWWSEVTRRNPVPAARRWLGNAVAIEALQLTLRTIDLEQRAL